MGRAYAPWGSRYGSLHFYQILAVIVPTYLVTDLLSLPEATQKTAVYMAARALTAAFGAGCVALTFLLAQHLFGRLTAVLSALFLALTVGFVNVAHFATTDIPMLFCMLAALLMSAYVLTSGERKWHVLAGVFAGFAAGTKYPGGIVLLNLIAAHLLSKRGDRDHVALLLGILASAISFVAVNPSLLFASCERPCPVVACASPARSRQAARLVSETSGRSGRTRSSCPADEGRAGSWRGPVSPGCPARLDAPGSRRASGSSGPAREDWFG